jgi:hypothetical protein
VWMNKRIVVYVSAALLLTGIGEQLAQDMEELNLITLIIVSGIANLVLVATSSPPVLVFGPFYRWPGVVFLASSLLSNAFSTIAIAWKAWWGKHFAFVSFCAHP